MNVSVKKKDPKLWRDLLGFWIIGLCNHFGATVILTGAYDLISRFDTMDVNKSVNSLPKLIEDSRNCHMMSTGAILLAAAIPSLISKTIASFCPLCIQLRVCICLASQVIGCLLVVYTNSKAAAYIGIGFGSCNIGLGEASFLAYTAKFNKKTISAFSSGTGASAIVGAVYYAGLKSIGFSTLNIILMMLIVPVVESIAFWLILRNPQQNLNENCIDDTEQSFVDQNKDENHMQNVVILDGKYKAKVEKIDEEELDGIMAKLKYLPQLTKYMIPLAAVFFLEYLINQGLYELIYIPNIWLDHAAQYRWFSVDYQIGVFLSRSSVNLVKITNLWLFVIVQATLLIVFTFEALYWFIPSIWVIFILILFEGLIGGSSYVNTFYRMSAEVPTSKKTFSFGIVVVFDVLGIVLAGFLAIPVHNSICQLPSPS